MMKLTHFERAIFLSWYCGRGDCKFCYMSTQKKRIKNPKLAKRRVESVLAEVMICKTAGWKIEFLSGGYESFEFWDWWWIFPVAMMVLCFFMMRGRTCCMMGGHDDQDATDLHRRASSDSAKEILDKRYALGELGKEEYEEKKKDISD